MKLFNIINRLNLGVVIGGLGWLTWFLFKNDGIGGILFAIVTVPLGLVYLLFSIIYAKHQSDKKSRPEKYPKTFDSVDIILLIIITPLFIGTILLIGYWLFQISIKV